MLILRVFFIITSQAGHLDYDLGAFLFCITFALPFGWWYHDSGVGKRINTPYIYFSLSLSADRLIFYSLDSIRLPLFYRRRWVAAIKNRGVEHSVLDFPIYLAYFPMRLLVKLICGPCGDFVVRVSCVSELHVFRDCVRRLTCLAWRLWSRFRLCRLGLASRLR